MPLRKFNTKDSSSTQRNHSVDKQPSIRKKSIFSSRNHSPPRTLPPRSASSSPGSGFFGHRRSSSSTGSDYENSERRSSGFLSRGRGGRLKDEPSIRGAREKVADAERAEKAADRALHESRQRVKLAQEHVRKLEHEVLEEARRAKAKQAEARLVSKSAKGLGRHGK